MSKLLRVEPVPGYKNARPAPSTEGLVMTALEKHYAEEGCRSKLGCTRTD
jgi:hypothetical protein